MLVIIVLQRGAGLSRIVARYERKAELLRRKNWHPHDSIYFSANTYTTIGYGKFLLPEDWRELSPVMAISGLFTFAWTTGEMFNVVHSQHELVAELSARRSKRKGLRRSKHQAVPPDSEPDHGESIRKL